ncbi:MAG: chemotaxis response regulator protein-glutamate methylesterase [Anaerolineaceae bacterium]|nr:chemotaxis response regulator protein-glutamate methylesterase [Anaerolineaceae bacterium]
MTDLHPKSGPIRVLVVDDSAFMRFSISKRLNGHPNISVVAVARDGKEALELIPKFNPDVLTLDVEMPRMDGLSTLKEVMKTYPRPVVMLSSLTSEGTVETIQALTLGAVDFIAKPAYKTNINEVLDEVVEKVVKAAGAKVWALKRPVALAKPLVERKIPQEKKTRAVRNNDKIVVFGTSTGGPRALNLVIPALPAELQAAFVVIQHMPAGFTRSLSERLDNNSSLLVKEGEPGESLEVGKCLVAPGGFHMVFDNNGKISLNQNPPVHGVRPSVDVTMLSLAQLYGDRTIGVILTGMGSDGSSGAALVHSMGGHVIAEAEESCVVWGMPRSVVAVVAASEVVPLDKISEAIIKAVE